jgi:hypothetical protein
MKWFSFLIFLIVSVNLQGQVLNRIYMNPNLGIRKHQKVGLTAHVFNHFSAAFFLGNTNVATGPVYWPSAGLFALGKRVKNNYTTSTFFIGLTTRTFERVNCSAMIGPEWISGTEHTNIEIHENTMSHTQSVTYDAVYKTGVGFAMRADMVISLGDHVGLNIGFQRNINPIHNNFSFLVGFCFGMVGDRYAYE